VKNVPDYCESKPAILPADTIASNLVHPATALIGGVFIVSVHVCDIYVHSIILASEFRIIFRGAIFEFPLISGDVMSRDGHVECAVYQ
jgi:hypothetical protein